MTVQKEWEEGLLAEWLSLKGYFVETNIPLKGNKEADVVAVRVDDGKIEIKHLEVGGLNQGYNTDLKTVTNKFQSPDMKFVKEYVLSRIENSTGQEPVYSCEYVYTFLSNIDRLTKELKELGITLTSFDDILNKEIPQTIESWKKRRIEIGAVGDTDWTYVQLPRDYRLLCVLNRFFEVNKLPPYD